MIQKNNILTCIIFISVGQGGKINRPGQLAPRGEDNQGGQKLANLDELTFV